MTALTNGAVTGAGTVASPLTTTTVYEARDGAIPLLRVTQVARYVNGQSRFRMTYDVQNLYSQALRFRAMTAGDLYVDGNDSGVGIFVGGTPRFVGGTNTASRITGGVEEVFSSRLPSDPANVPVPAWAGYEVNGYSTVFARLTQLDGFTNFIQGNFVDNGVGVEWEDHLPMGQGLAPGQRARYETLWRVRQALPLTLNPTSAAPEVGSPHTVTATLRNSNDQPVNGTTIRWDVAGVNPGSGNAVSSGNGQVQISWTGATAGLDTLTAFADTNGNGTRESDEPAQSALARWRPESDVDPPVIGNVPMPNGGNVNINVQGGDDGSIGRWFSIPRSQAGQFPSCGGGSEMNLPVNVPVSAGSGQLVAGSVQMLMVDPDSDDVEHPMQTLAPGSSASGIFQFVIGCVRRADLYVCYRITENNQTERFCVPVGGLVLIDPQGVVYDAEQYAALVAGGASEEDARRQSAIEGATVRLQRRVDGEFRNVLSGDPGIAPNVNPEVTREDGRYQWDVAEGTYRVVVTKDGYDTHESRSVDIPPPVLDLHIPMVRPGRNVEQVTAAAQAKAAEAKALASSAGGPATVIRTRYVTFRLLERPAVDRRRRTTLGTATCRLTTADCTNVLVRLMATSAQYLGTRARAAQRPRLRQLHLRSFRVGRGKTVALRMRVGPRAHDASWRGLNGVVAVRDTRANKDADQVARVRIRARR
jgi:hypothetical protein